LAPGSIEAMKIAAHSKAMLIHIGSHIFSVIARDASVGLRSGTMYDTAFR
jgi:hypothetical protein